MMLQKRQAASDWVKQDAAYEINVKLELQMMRFHEKLVILQDEAFKN